MAGRIPQSFINDLIDRVDIVDVIDTRVTLKKAGKNYQARCPFHDEKTPSFSVSPDKQFYHCFGCGVSGTALTFLMEYERLEFVDAVEALARIAGVEVPREGTRQQTPDHRKLYAALSAAEGWFRQSLKTASEAVAYLKNRGLTGMVARDFAIGFAPDEWQALGDALATSHSREDLLKAGLLTENDNGKVYDRFRGRIVFPIRDTRGRVVGFGGRVMSSDAGPKYLNSPETPVFHKGRELYGLYEARKALRRIDKLLVVEGYMDVVALAQAGIANCVASLGTATTADHFHKLYRYCEEVVCCFDGDSAGRQAAWRALENALPTLTEGRQLKFMFLPDGEDPDSLVRKEGKDRFLARVDAASPAIEYLFSRLGEGLDLDQLDGQARLASLAMPYLRQVPGGILKQLMNRRLQVLTGFSGEEDGAEVPSGRAAVAPAVPAKPAKSSQNSRLSVLQRKLLRYLLASPALAERMPDEIRAAVAELASQDTFSDIVNYVAKNPEADQSDVLGRWTGHAVQAELLKLLEQPLGMDIEAAGVEFEEGMVRFVGIARRAERRQLLARLQNDPSTENLRELMAKAKKN
jgi:DNA primase